MYFEQPEKSTLFKIEPSSYKESGTTDTLNVQLYSWASAGESWKVTANDQSVVRVARAHVKLCLAQRDGEAITFALFSPNLTAGEAKSSVSGIIQRQISLLYTLHYLQYGKGEIPTGLAGFDFFDENLPGSFPLYDLGLLQALFSLIGLSDIIVRPIDDYKDIWTQVDIWRGNFPHREFRNQIHLLLRALHLEVLAQNATLVASRYATRQAMQSRLYSAGGGVGQFSRLDWENIYSRVRGIVGILSRSMEFARSMEIIRQEEGADRVDVLLVTVTEVEKNAVLDAFKKAVGYEHRLTFIRNKSYYMLGTFGGSSVAMVQSEMGYSGPGAALTTVANACNDLHPTAVIAVGVAFGIHKAKQHLGDILVSKQVHGYELQRVGTDKGGEVRVVPRGSVVDASPRLLDRSRSASTSWKGAPISFGLIISGEKLVDNIDFRRQITEGQPEAIGGEMEAAGIYTGAFENNTDWIVVKAICDWADGEKGTNKNARQRRAAENAAQFVVHTIMLGGLTSNQRL
jgi:nucleoside phosphorylase